MLHHLQRAEIEQKRKEKKERKKERKKVIWFQEKNPREKADQNGKIQSGNKDELIRKFYADFIDWRSLGVLQIHSKRGPTTLALCRVN